MQPERHGTDTLLPGPNENDKTMHEQSSAVEGGTRIDPLKTIVDPDLLRMASDLYRLNQNEGYWKRVPVPTRPLGKVRGEYAFQMGVFALPVLAYLVASMVFGFGHALYGLPLYYALFTSLEKTLLTAMMKRRQEEEDLDRGRYAFTKILGDRLGLKPEEVTLDVVLKMTCDYGILSIYGLNMPTEEKDAFMRRAYAIADFHERLDVICAYFKEKKHLARRVKKEVKPPPAATGRAIGGRISAAASALAAANDDDDDRPSPYAPVNVMTGLPMIQGTPFDIGGNVYGQGTLGGFD